MKTQLQDKLQQVYSEYKTNFGNDDLLKEVVSIAGNVGFSHLKRIEKIKGLVSAPQLSDAQKEYVSKLMSTSYDYIKNSVRSGRQIKDTFRAARRVAELKEDYSPKSLEIKAEATADNRTSSLEAVSQNPFSQVNFPKSPIYQKPAAKYSFFKKIAGTAAAAVLIGAVIGNELPQNYIEPIFASSSYQAKPVQRIRPSIRSRYCQKNEPASQPVVNQVKSEEPVIKNLVKEVKQKISQAKLELQINYLKALNHQLDNELKTEKKQQESLQKKVANYEVIDLERQNLQALNNHLEGKLNEQKRTGNELYAKVNAYELAEYARQEIINKQNLEESLRLKEAQTVHQIVSNSGLSLPSFPLARAVINAKTNTIEEIYCIEYNPQENFDVIDTIPELNKIAQVIDSIYVPRTHDSQAFERLAQNIGIDQSFVMQAETSCDETSLDRLVGFSQEYQGSLSGKFPGLIKRVFPDKKKVVVIGSLDTIKNLKTKK